VSVAGGVVHSVGTLAALAAGSVLLASTLFEVRSAEAVAAAICVGTRGSHRLPRVQHVAVSPAKQLRARLDQAAIFLFIAGTYTPFLVLTAGSSTGAILLAVHGVTDIFTDKTSTRRNGPGQRQRTLVYQAGGAAAAVMGPSHPLNKAWRMNRVDPVRRLAVEALGTCLLVATVVGSGIMAQDLTSDTALALLANTIATGAILVVLIAVFGPLSGAHFNPAVSLVFALRRELPAIEMAGYIVVQVLGGIVGTLLAHSMFAQPLFEVSTTIRTGAGQWLAEAVATFGLIAVILGGLRFQRRALPHLVGLYITAAYWFTASTSFANPAVAIARALTASFSGIRPVDVPCFIVAELTGAAAALTLMTWLLRVTDAACIPLNPEEPS